MTTEQNCITNVVAVVSTTDERKNVAVGFPWNNGAVKAAKIAQRREGLQPAVLCN